MGKYSHHPIHADDNIYCWWSAASLHVRWQTFGFVIDMQYLNYSADVKCRHLQEFVSLCVGKVISMCWFIDTVIG